MVKDETSERCINDIIAIANENQRLKKENAALTEKVKELEEAEKTTILFLPDNLIDMERAFDKTIYNALYTTYRAYHRKTKPNMDDVYITKCTCNSMRAVFIYMDFSIQDYHECMEYALKMGLGFMLVRKAVLLQCEKFSEGYNMYDIFLKHFSDKLKVDIPMAKKIIEKYYDLAVSAGRFQGIAMLAKGNKAQ